MTANAFRTFSTWMAAAFTSTLFIAATTSFAHGI